MKLNLILNTLFLLLFIASMKLHAKTEFIPTNSLDTFEASKLETMVNRETIEELNGAEKQWYLFDPNTATTINSQEIKYPGIGYLTLIDFLSSQQIQNVPFKPEVTIVAVIDSGTDINHEGFKDKLWQNEAEVNGTPGVDDDNNGYIDDYYGWNFIGKTLDPKDYATIGDEVPLNGLGADVAVDADTYEITRNKLFLEKYAKLIDESKQAYWQENLQIIDLAIKEKIVKSNANVFNWKQYESILGPNKKKLDDHYANSPEAMVILSDYLDPGKMAMYNRYNEKINFSLELPVQEAKEVSKKYFGWFYERVKNSWMGGLDHFNLEPKYREIVGDSETYDLWPEPIRELEEDEKKNYLPLLTRENLINGIHTVYGNNDVIGTRNFHGTHVSGLIGLRDYTGSNLMTALFQSAVRDNIKIMTLRTVPGGDERDKDVANSIVYAVDNGAHYINMSFGKTHPSLYFDQKTNSIRNGQKLVQWATEYARRKDLPNKNYETVLVHASGNGKLNTSNLEARNYPTRYYQSNGEIREHSNWIEIGASTRSVQPTNIAGKFLGIAADFTNFGKYTVDVLSPGKEILSTVPGGGYDFAQGTSMAAPIATGVLAELKSRFSKYSPSEIAAVTLANSYQIDQKIQVPSSGISAEAKETSILLKDYFIYDSVINIKSSFDVLNSFKATKPQVKPEEPKTEVKKRGKFVNWLRRIFKRRHRKHKEISTPQIVTNSTGGDLNKIITERNKKYKENLKSFGPTEEYIYGYKLSN